MVPTTRAGSELQLQPKKVEIVVNSLLYFVQNAMVGGCHSDPTLSEAEIQRNSDWICEEILIFHETDKCTQLDIEAALEVLLDVSKPWFTSDMRQLTKVPIKKIPELTRYRSLVSGVAFAAKSKKCTVRFATVDRNYPSFEEVNRCTEDQMTMTEQSCLEPLNELPEDRVITQGNNFHLLMNEIKTLKTLILNGNEKIRRNPIASFVPAPILETATAQNPASPAKVQRTRETTKKKHLPISSPTAVPIVVTAAGPRAGSSKESTSPVSPEIPWTQVLKRTRKTVLPKATIGISESSHLAAARSRPVSIFISRLSALTTEDDVKRFLQALPLIPTHVTKLVTKFDTYSSYRVVIDMGNNSWNDILQPSLWPRNVLVRRYYESRNPSATPPDSLIRNV